jgi:hypothetical protein
VPTLTARDLRYGRGAYIDGTPIVLVPCEYCGRPVTTGGDHHVECGPDPDQLSLFDDG